MSQFKIYQGDCLEELSFFMDNSVDAIVTDPPYGLSFMGKHWDYDVPRADVWCECLRVLKPGGHLLSFFGTRTYHRGVVQIEDAGFEIRDQIAWVYGSGFPKSLNVANAIHDAAIGQPQGGSKPSSQNHGKFKGGCSDENKTGRGFGAGPSQFMAEAGSRAERPLVDQAQPWQGWGTALKPALEPICVARKPLIGTVAANVLAHGTGGLNIDRCRVETTENLNGGAYAKNATDRSELWGADAGNSWVRGGAGDFVQPAGRWPANLIYDGSEEVLATFPQAQGQQGKTAERKQGVVFRNVTEGKVGIHPRGDNGSAARFFYCAKASKRDRDDGLDALPTVTADPYGQHRGRRMDGNETRIDGKPPAQGKNNHPTVKPTDLMRYLCRLVTPPGGVVLDPFMGSGSTGKAAMLEGFRFIGIEREADYVEIARNRILAAQREADEL